MEWRNYLVKASWLRYLIPALAVGLAVWWLRSAPSPPPFTSTPGPVTVAPVPTVVERIIEKIKVVKVPGPERIVFLEKAALATALKMPELNALSDNVLSVASVKPHTGPTTAIALLSPTGEGRIILRQEPTPFWDLKREIRLQGRYLFAGQNLTELDLLANPIRVGPVNLLAGVGVELDRDSSSLRGRAFVGFEYRF